MLERALVKRKKKKKKEHWFEIKEMTQVLAL